MYVSACMYVFLLCGRSFAACCSVSRQFPPGSGQYLSETWREIAHSHRFLRCFMDTCSAFPISMYVCMCSWSDLLFCLFNRNMDILYWQRQQRKGNRPWRRSFCWPEQILKQQTRWLTNCAWQNGLCVATWRSIYLWRRIPFSFFLCDKNH